MLLDIILTRTPISRFLLAVLHTNLLAGEDNKRDLLKALRNLPTELADTYDQSMLRIEDQTPQQIKRAKQVLSWVTLAERPLTVREMQHALAVAPEDTFLDEDALPDEDLMVSVCAGLVVIDQQESIIRLVHYTTQDYLERTLEARYPHAQRNICATCITYLSFKVFAVAVEPSKLVPYSLTREEINRLEENVLLAYAARNWGNHARKALGQDTIIEELVRGFLSSGANLSSSNRILYDQISPSVAPTDATALNTAAFFGLERMVMTLLRDGDDVNAKDPKGWSALQVAAGTEHENIVKLLLENGADFEAKDKSGNTALYWAVAAGRELSVQMLLEMGSDPTTCDEVGSDSIIRKAAFNGHAKVVHLLLLHVRDIKRKNDWASSALAEGTKSGQETVVNMILEGYADPEVKRRDVAVVLGEAVWHKDTSLLQLLLGHVHIAETVDEAIQSALRRAASISNESATRLLLEAGADPNQRPEGYRDPIMHYAIRNSTDTSRSLRIVQLLVKAGGDIESTNSMGWTPLLLAAKEGMTELVRFLLEMGASVATQELQTGRTALQWAAIAGDLESVHLLLQRQDQSTTDNVKWLTFARSFQAVRENEAAALLQILKEANSLDPGDSQLLILWHLVAKQGHESAVEALLNLGINLEAKDEHGNTVLNLAAKSGHENVLRLLLGKGANIDAESYDKSYGGTPLSHVVERKSTRVVRLLLDAGAKVETEHQRKTGRTPLHIATGLAVDRSVVDKELETIVQMLLEHGASTEIASHGPYYVGCTPLIMMAANSESLNILRLLLANGAKMEAKTTAGRTALCIAARNGAIDCIRLLLERGADPKSVDLATITRWRVTAENYDEGIRLIQDAQRERNAKSGTVSEVENQVTEVEAEY